MKYCKDNYNRNPTVRECVTFVPAFIVDEYHRLAEAYVCSKGIQTWAAVKEGLVVLIESGLFSLSDDDDLDDLDRAPDEMLQMVRDLMCKQNYFVNQTR